MKLLLIILLASTSYQLVDAVLPKPHINRQSNKDLPPNNKHISDDPIIEALRQRIYQKIETVKWKGHLKSWVDVGVHMLSGPISRINEAVISMGYDPTYEQVMAKTRQLIWEKSHRAMDIVWGKLSWLLGVLHAKILTTLEQKKKQNLDHMEVLEEPEKLDVQYKDYEVYMRESRK
ncbi:uncharacterized protein LOC117900388 [Drosophila subobscura]|uniref:uncharacterized protein LOC117900388 n=1 Tax=Drosophila subobscura TaxID=7241 RepID=UPI00155A31EA|nr:uncharacterized protein LOC117900388 [Drosophila subobscura]